MKTWYELTKGEVTAIERIVESLKNDSELLKLMKEARDNPYKRDLGGFIKNEVNRLFFYETIKEYTLKKHYLDLEWIEEDGVIYDLEKIKDYVKIGLKGQNEIKTGREVKVKREHEQDNED